LSYAADKQTNRRTDSKILPMPTYIVSEGNNPVFPQSSREHVLCGEFLCLFTMQRIAYA